MVDPCGSIADYHHFCDCELQPVTEEGDLRKCAISAWMGCHGVQMFLFVGNTGHGIIVGIARFRTLKSVGWDQISRNQHITIHPLSSKE